MLCIFSVEKPFKANTAPLLIRIAKYNCEKTLVTLSKMMDIKFRIPTDKDALALHQLVDHAGTLDTNSIYCNLLQFSHFSETAILAEHDGKLIGSVTGYRLPKEPNTLFVWQVAVDPEYRGQKIASKMLKSLSERVVKLGVTHVETTITKDNQASQKLFKRFFAQVGQTHSCKPYFESDTHFQDRAATEFLHRSDLSQLTS